MNVSGIKFGLMTGLAVAALAGEPGLRRDGMDQQRRQARSQEKAPELIHARERR